MPKVSVVIPCYNQGQYLDEAVDSVLNQTYRDFEIIIVNDGSTDAFTNQLLSAYHKEKTRVLSTLNGGLASARNAGIRESMGEFILPLDADDRIAPAYLEKAVKVLEENSDIGIVYCRGELFGAKRGVIPAPDFSIRKMLLTNLVFASALFRKEDWLRSGGYNANMVHGCEDWDFWLTLIELGRSVYRIPEVLFYYRIKDTSMNTSMDREKRLDMHMQLVQNHRELYAANIMPLLRMYYGITGSWPYKLAKRMNLLTFFQRMLKL